MTDEVDAQQQIAFAAGHFQANPTVRILLESLAEAVVIVDQKGRIVLFNRQAVRMFGYAADAVLGRSLTILLPDRYARIHDLHIAHFFADPHPRPMGMGMDLMAIRSDGNEFPVEVSLSFLETEVGIFGLAYVTDISERKEREWDLQARNQELEAFAHMVAHDLKSSLTLLIGYGDLLEAEHSAMTDTEVEENLRLVVESAQKMNSIIQELLLFANLRKEDVEAAPVDTREIVGNALHRLQREVSQRTARIELPDRFEQVVGYGPWLEEVWFNYLSNAIKYGGEPPLIRVGSQVEDGVVRFWVADNGKGLSQREQEGLFEPFARRHTGIAQGHGLGLSIVKRIITKLSGQVGVSSVPGQGTTFYFTLPAQPAPPV